MLFSRQQAPGGRDRNAAMQLRQPERASGLVRLQAGHFLLR
jgi:hypothetical protein